MPPGVKLGDDAMKSRNYLDAVRNYETALAEATSTDNKKSIGIKLEAAKVQLVDEYLARAEAALASDETTRIAALDRVAVILNEVLPYDDAQQRVAVRLQQYSDEKLATVALTEQHIKDYRNLVQQYRFEEARQELEKALTLDPNNSSLQEKKLTVLNLEKNYLEMKDALHRKELTLAMDKYQAMVNISPVALVFEDIPLRAAFVDLILIRSKELQDEKNWWDAYHFLSAWDAPELEADLQVVRIEGAAWYLKQAKNALKQKKLFKGYLLIERAFLLDSRHPDIFAVHRSLGDRVDRSMQSNIAIASFDSPSNDPDAGKQFTDSLISYLYEVFPYGINILEREKIDLIKKEQAAGEEDLAQILGVDLMVTGTVSLFKVDKNIDERTATVKIKVNEEIDYDKMLALFGADRELWPKNEAQMPKKSIIESISYKKGKAELQGFAKVSVRIFDTNKGAIAFVKDYEANVHHSSDFQDEVLDANIQYKPIDLPTATEAKEDMRKKIVTQIGRVVQSSFENREVRFLHQARFYIGRKEYNHALRPIAEGYLYCQKSKGNEKQSCQEIRELADDIL
jgi:tetratricopeptide (TPR) repeat protein